ncbi:MAG: peptidase and matrixin and adamalysin [bacterium]|nr:peptidase and matrixin and adamalysin [bacterium]
MSRALAVGVVVASLAAPASAFVRSRTEKGTAVAWSGSCAYVQPDSAGTPDMPADQFFSVVQKSLTNWTNAIGDQAYLKLVYSPPAALEAHLDGVNTIKFRTDRWCHPNDTQQNNVCYSSAAAGITTVFFVQDGSNRAGTILDADIELNDINFTFAVLPSTGQPRDGTTFADLENTLTHELGHLQGLDHTCKDQATPPQEVDDSGSAPPDCGSLTSLPLAEQTKIKLATMYNFAQPGEISKRSPEVDDVNGIANAYPPASDPSSCKMTDLNAFKTGGCTIAGRAPRSLAALAVLFAVLVALVARRRWM